MPLPEFILTANILVCERLLLEQDGIASAIRVVDIFHVGVPEKLPADSVPMIQTYAWVQLKSAPGYSGKHVVQIRIINTVGESSVIVEQPDAAFEAKPGFEELPRAISLVVQLNLAVKRFGTCYVCVDVDGGEVARTPLTLLERQAETTAS